MTRPITKIHSAAHMYAQEFEEGAMSRREFLTRATSLGLSATAAYAMIGMSSPVNAAAHVQTGGTL